MRRHAAACTAQACWYLLYSLVMRMSVVCTACAPPDPPAYLQLLGDAVHCWLQLPALGLDHLQGTFGGQGHRMGCLRAGRV